MFAPFTPQMFQLFANARGLFFMADQDGDMMIPLELPELPKLTVALTTEADGALATVRVFAPQERFTVDQEDLLLAACAAFNRTHRWPKAYPSLDGGEIEIILEGDLIVHHGVTRDLLEAFIDRHVSGAVDFWQGFDLERRLEAAG